MVIHAMSSSNIKALRLSGFTENQTIFWDFKIWNGVRITEGSDNGDSDNWGPTILWICAI